MSLPLRLVTKPLPARRLSTIGIRDLAVGSTISFLVGHQQRDRRFMQEAVGHTAEKPLQ